VKEMKNKPIITGALIAVALSVLLLAGCQSAATSSSGNSSQQTGIWVTGEGKVSAAPDIATVQLGIEAQASTVAEAQNQATTAMDRVLAALKAGGVADKDIQTRYYNIQKVTRWDSDRQEEITTGYRVTNLVTVKIKEIITAGALIDSVVAAGGDLTRIDSITFTIDDPIRYYDQARQKAMADAADKAKSLAQLAGVKLGKPTYISESGSSISTPSPVYYGKASAESSAITQVSAGEMDVILNIQVVYSIR
jgi:hypothetical protein